MKSWRKWVAALPLYVLRQTIVFCEWLIPIADLAWHRLRWWALGHVWHVQPKREGGPVEVVNLAAVHVPVPALKVETLPGGVILDYSHELAPDEGWPEEGVDPLANTPGCQSHGIENCYACKVAE